MSEEQDQALSAGAEDQSLSGSPTEEQTPTEQGQPDAGGQAGVDGEQESGKSGPPEHVPYARFQEKVRQTQELEDRIRQLEAMGSNAAAQGLDTATTQTGGGTDPYHVPDNVLQQYLPAGYTCDDLTPAERRGIELNVRAIQTQQRQTAEQNVSAYLRERDRLSESAGIALSEAEKQEIDSVATALFLGATAQGRNVTAEQVASTAFHAHQAQRLTANKQKEERDRQIAEQKAQIAQGRLGGGGAPTGQVRKSIANPREAAEEALKTLTPAQKAELGIT